jgi:hypothetical protein
MKRRLVTSSVLAAGILGFTLVSGAEAQVALATPSQTLAAIFAGVSLPQADLMPEPELKCSLTCLPFNRTSPTITASGASCTSATSSLISQLQAIVDADCVNRNKDGYCNFVLHPTTSCTLTESGAYEITGFATYNCGITTC